MNHRYAGSALFPPDSIYRVIMPLLDQALVFDIGANRGLMTRLFNEAGAATVAVEPQSFLVDENPENFAACRAIEHCCVAAEDGSVNFYPSERDTISSCNPEWRDGYFKDDPESRSLPKQTIPAISLQSLIRKYGAPKYIKIDVEGFEDQVLAGLETRVELLSFEYTGGYPEVFEACAQQIRRLGYGPMIAFEEKKKDHRKLGRIFELEDADDALEYFRALDRYRQGDLLLLGPGAAIDLRLLETVAHEEPAA